jgi:hypothetical protein
LAAQGRFLAQSRPFHPLDLVKSVTDKGISMTNKGISMTNKGNSVTNKGNSVTNKGNSVTNKGNSVTDKGKSEANHVPATLNPLALESALAERSGDGAFDRPKAAPRSA